MTSEVMAQSEARNEASEGSKTMTTDASTADTSATVAAYLDAWNEPDAVKQAPVIERVWASGGCLIDPPFVAERHAGILEATSGVHAQYPDHSFRQTSAVDTHHNQFRYPWEFVAPDGAGALAGVDIGEVTEDGKLQRMTGFWGDLGGLE